MTNKITKEKFKMYKIKKSNICIKKEKILNLKIIKNFIFLIKLNSPNIIQIYDINDIFDDFVFYYYNYIESNFRIISTY